MSVAHWAYNSLLEFHQENSRVSELLLGAVAQQVAVSMLARYLDRLWVAMRWVAQALQGSSLRLLEWARLCCAASKDLDAVTTILPATTIPFSQRFPGPHSATLSRLTSASISLCLVVGNKDASEQGGCSFGATKEPVCTRFQNSRTSKMAFRYSSKQALHSKSRPPVYSSLFCVSMPRLSSCRS